VLTLQQPLPTLQAAPAATAAATAAAAAAAARDAALTRYLAHLRAARSRPAGEHWGKQAGVGNKAADEGKEDEETGDDGDEEEALVEGTLMRASDSEVSRACLTTPRRTYLLGSERKRKGTAIHGESIEPTCARSGPQ